MPLYLWSQTAASNASADPTVNFAEGQPPSSLNDSNRAAMAATAKYRDDIAGAIVTAGTSTAYTVFSFSAFDTLAHLAGQVIAFTPHATNGATVTLNIDSLGPKPLRSAPNVELLPGTIIQGTPYVAVYNNTDGVFYLQGFFGNPYNVPLLGGMDFWDTTAPNSSFIFPIGQALSRTVYAAAFARWGTTFGAGDGSTTFNVPNKAGRVSAMVDPSGSILTPVTVSPNGNTLGATGGAQAQDIAQGQLPNVDLTVTVSGAVFTINTNVLLGTLQNLNNGTGTGGVFQGILNTTGQSAQIESTGSMSGATSSLSGGGAQSAMGMLQPTIVCNYIIRII